MCHNGANRTERGARGPESGIGAAAQALVRGSARGCAGVCRGVECVGTGRVARRLRGGVAAGSVAAGGLSGWRADGAQRRTGWRVVVVVSCGWPLAGLLRDCCGRLAGCGGRRVQAGRRLRGLLREWLLWGRNAPGEKCVGIAGFVAVWGADGCGGVDRKAGFLSPGRAIGMESRRGTAADRAVVMKGRGSGRGGCREPAERIAVWMV